MQLTHDIVLSLKWTVPKDHHRSTSQPHRHTPSFCGENIHDVLSQQLIFLTVSFPGQKFLILMKSVFNFFHVLSKNPQVVKLLFHVAFMFKSRVHLELMFSVYGVRQGLRSLPSRRVSSYASTICGELSYWVALVPGAKICWPNNKCGS